eukprot:Phypoly_transcript_16121.p1 GENE.Phypoly_transcript_16121~~Phypoly_transcript_16121.p1  ORF type:complete len:235 (-),score=31.95 Phypoly_transcript_16121:64-768(-)
MLMDKQKAFSTSLLEKNTRASLKASVERFLTKDVTVISDSLNYIKGYRYELFCIARAASTPMCVIMCDTPPEVCSEWNSQRPEAERWDEGLFNELTMRFETPNPRNKWDSQLIVIHPEEPMQFETIKKFLYEKSTLKANQATQQQVLSDTNFVHQAEKITQDIMTGILANPTALPGDSIKVPHTDKLVVVQHAPNLAELRRLRKQFFKFVQMHPPPIHEIGTSFVDFLNINANG